MLDNFRFETFVDVHSNIFAEYLSSVIAKLPKENPEYRSIEERIEELYKNRLSDMQQEAIYFRGCYDSVGYLKKAGIL